MEKNIYKNIELILQIKNLKILKLSLLIIVQLTQVQGYLKKLKIEDFIIKPQKN